MRIRCETAVLDTIVAHARATRPMEACGLLEATADQLGWTVIRAMACANRALAPAHRFQLDPVEFAAAEGEARARGNSLVGVYHSHPQGPSGLSQADRDQAWPDLVQVLCDLTRAEAPEIRAFGWHGEQLIEIRGFVAENWTPTTWSRPRPRSSRASR